MTPALRVLATKAYLRRLALSSKPILIGPWRSEVGFEGLYWLPFLRWAVKYAKLDPKRLAVVSRGGAGILYGCPSIDLYQLRSVETVRQENLYDWQKTQLQKQTAFTAWDRDVLKEAAARLLGRGADYCVLHPAWMYWTLSPFWDEARGMHYLGGLTDFTPLAKPPVASIDLPPKYVAMKWYDRATFPRQHEAVQQAVKQLTAIVGAQTPIVMLTSHLTTDDHADIRVEHPNVQYLPQVPPEQNLALQAQVLAHATAFVGTYGGVAQLALRLGVPSISLYHEFGGTAHAHLSLSGYLSKKTKVPFLVGSIDDAKLWAQVVSVTQMVAAPVEAPRELVTA